MKKFLFFSFLTFILFSCKHDLENPNWEVDMIVPIANAEVNISDIIKESNTPILTSLNSDSLVSLVYSTELLQTEYESLLNINSTSVEKNFRIDSVQFEDVEIEYFTTIGSVIDQLGPLGSALYPDGSMREIPALPNIIQNDSINIDASNYFQTMTLYSGMMNLEITNGFPTSISNMTLLLYNANNQNLIATFSIPLIESGESYFESVSVANQTLDNLMIGLIDNMDIDPSNGLIPINYTDALVTKISITNIQIMEATAYFPNQLLHEEIVEQSFDIGSARLTELGIKQGNVSIIASSSLPDTVSVIYKIPSLTKNDVPFETLVKIPPNINTTPTNLFFDFNGYKMNLKGKEGRIGGDTVNTIYSEMYIYLDSTGELETINQVDSFSLYNIYNITPEYAKGYIGQDTFVINSETRNTSIFNNISDGTISLEEANLNLLIENNVGADAILKFNEFNTDNTEDNLPAVSVSIDENGNNIINYPYSIDRASLINEIITPTKTEIKLDASDMIEILPNQTTIGATIMLNPNGAQNIEDFIYLEHPITASLNANIPLSFIANNLTLSKTTELDLNWENDQEIDELFITIENGLPLEGIIDITFLDQNHNLIDTVIKNYSIISATTNDENNVVSSSKNTINIFKTDFANVSKMNIKASFTTSSISEATNIYSYYNLKLNLSARFKQKLGE